MNQPRIEGVKDHSGTFIYGRHQHPNHVPSVDEIKSVDEQGNFVNKKKPTDEQIICNFWGKQQKKLGLLLLFSAGIPFSILVQETNIFEMLFEPVFDYALMGFNYFVQVFL